MINIICIQNIRIRIINWLARGGGGGRLAWWVTSIIYSVLYLLRPIHLTATTNAVSVYVVLLLLSLFPLRHPLLIYLLFLLTLLLLLLLFFIYYYYCFFVDVFLIIMLIVCCFWYGYFLLVLLLVAVVLFLFLLFLFLLLLLLLLTTSVHYYYYKRMNKQNITTTTSPSAIITSTFCLLNYDRGTIRLDVVFQSNQTRITRSFQYKLYGRRHKLKNKWKYQIEKSLISLVG